MRTADEQNKRTHMLCKCEGMCSQTHHFLSSILFIFNYTANWLWSENCLFRDGTGKREVWKEGCDNVWEMHSHLVFSDFSCVLCLLSVGQVWQEALQHSLCPLHSEISTQRSFPLWYGNIKLHPPGMYLCWRGLRHAALVSSIAIGLPVQKHWNESVCSPTLL